MNESVLDFSVFLIHSLSVAWNKVPSQVYFILNDTKILDDYVISCYDTLHTQGKNALIDDITSFAKEKGAAI